MKLATTTCDFDRYCKGYCESVKCISEAGFKYIDISFRKNASEELFSDDWKPAAEKIKKYADELGVKFVQSHCPSQQNLYVPWVNKTDVYNDMVRCIDVCGALGIPNMVIHAQRSDDFGFEFEKWREVNRDTLLSFVPWLEENGVNLLIENGPKKHTLATRPNGEPYDPPRYYCGYTNGQEMMDFLEYVNHPMIHACWDTGHGNMDGPQYENLVTLGDELRAVHVHDNSGERDMHLLPYSGTMNLDDLMNGLLDCGYKGYFTFEACNSLGVESLRISERRQFDADSRLYKPSLEVKCAAERLMYVMGEHILKSYGCFEE